MQMPAESEQYSGWINPLVQTLLETGSRQTNSTAIKSLFLLNLFKGLRERPHLVRTLSCPPPPLIQALDLFRYCELTGMNQLKGSA